MALNYAYNYAYIDPETNECVEFFSQSTRPTDFTNLVEVPVNDPEYMGKYYIDGNWYEDEAGTIPWTSSLI